MGSWAVHDGVQGMVGSLGYNWQISVVSFVCFLNSSSYLILSRNYNITLTFGSLTFGSFSEVL